MGGGQLLLLGSLSLGGTDAQAEGTCQGSSRSWHCTDTRHHNRGGEGQGKKSLDRRSLYREGELCPGPLCLYTLQGCTWAVGASEPPAAEQEGRISVHLPPEEETPELHLVGGLRVSLTSGIPPAEGRQCRTGPVGLVQVTVLCF